MSRKHAKTTVSLTFLIAALGSGLMPTLAAEPTKVIEQKITIAEKVKKLSDLSRKAAAVYGDVNMAVDVGVAFAEAVGLIKSVPAVNLREEFDKLNYKLDALSNQIDKSVAHSDWATRVDRSNLRFSVALAAVDVAGRAVAARIQLADDAPAMVSSAGVVNQMLHEKEYLRYYVNGDRGEAEDQEMGYDWTYGIPHFMELIAMRIQVIAAHNPDFRSVPGFQTELSRYHLALQGHYDRMLAGIQCQGRLGLDTNGCGSDGICGGIGGGADLLIDMQCVDVHTGISAHNSFRFPPGTYAPAPGPGFDEGTPDLDGESKREFQRLRSEVVLKMPLYEIRSLIDTLHSYERPELELHTGAQRIAVSAAKNLCLDVQWGNSNPGTPVHLWPCDGGDAQRWVYDRQSGSIRNPVYNMCLDVQWGNSAPGAPVHIWECNGGDAQKWTYDPEKQVFQNALGTVLDVPGGVLEAGMVVSTWSRHEGEAQQWTVEH